MEVSICSILSIQLVLVLLFAAGVFIYAIYLEERSIQESLAHGEDAVGVCFDRYVESIESVGKEFVADISLQLTNHVRDVVDFAEDTARSAATAVERTNFMEGMETNAWHGSQMLPSIGWMILGPLESQRGPSEGDAVVADVVVASLNSTEEYNNWVWWGLSSRNPNRDLACDFYYYRNATNASSSLWCLQDLYDEPEQPSPSIYPHLYSPAIVKLQESTACDVAFNPTEPRPLVWMPLNFFVWTYNVVALTSVVSGIFGPDGSCQGVAAANVKFNTMTSYLTSLVSSARYENLSIALIESDSGTILGSSLGSAIYKVNHTRQDGTVVEQERAATLAQMENPLAQALHLHIEEAYGSVSLIPTPLITSATLEGEDYFISFETFSRPALNLIICAFLPHASITGPIEAERIDSYISYEASADQISENMNDRLMLVIAIGAGVLAACAIAASIASAYISLRIRSLVKHMNKVSSKIAKIVGGGGDSDSLTQSNRTMGSSESSLLCDPLPKDYFPVLDTTKLKDINIISGATEDLCEELLNTWNENQEVFKRALEQRQFTASIAHDIRNPLHGVLGIVSMMQNDMEAHKDKLPLLDDTLKHMGVLLNDMVDLSKIQSGKNLHALKPFDAWETVNEVVTLYQGNVVAGGGNLSCVDLEKGSLPAGYADPVHVQRIVTNFVSNAVKYAPGSEIVLKAMTATRAELKSRAFLHNLSRFGKNAPHWDRHARYESDKYIVLACVDEGRGIPLSKLKEVYEAYQQTRSSDRFKGAGLGLAICKGLAVEMKGGAGVQSEEGVGSVFWIIIPCSDKPLKKHEVVEEPTSPSPPIVLRSQSSFTGLHVLVVDDTRLNLMLLKNFLKRLGAEPETTDNAPDALSKLREDPKKFGLIISDFNMPEMSGGEMCQEVRKDQDLRHIPFICSSGNRLSRDEKNFYKIDSTLMKPFTIDQLRKILNRYVNHPSRWSPGAEHTSVSDSDGSFTEAMFSA